MGRTRPAEGEPTIVKKYANRRLYDTGRSSYVTLEDLCEMIKEGHDFVVKDAKSGEDLTRSVLTQIIAEQEAKGEQNLLPIGFLRKLISFYGDSIQGAVPNYLESTLDIFVRNQERMREQINKSFEGMRNMEGMFPNPTSAPFPGREALEEMNRQNMAMFERTMKMFTPFSATSGAANEAEAAEKIDQLKKNIEEMQKEINRLQGS